MVAEHVADTSRCQRVQRSRSMFCDMSVGVPDWNGDMLTNRDYETAALWFRGGFDIW